MSCAEKVVAGTMTPRVRVDESPDPPLPPDEPPLDELPPQADTVNAMTATAATARVLNRNIIDPL